MKRYFLLIFSFVWCVVAYSQSKMSTNTSLLLMSMKQNRLPTSTTDGYDKSFVIYNRGGEKCVNAFIHLSDVDEVCHALEALGVKINSRFSGIITANVPIDKIEEIVALEGVTYIEVGSPVHGLMDNARVAMGVDKVQSGIDLPHSFLGTGVIVGVVDLGIEYGHPNFYNYDKTELRVKRVWDMFHNTGTPPQGFNYGTELTTKEEILNAKFDTDDDSHGTHVTGIAAGADTVGNKFYGIAGDADIVLVGYNNKFDIITICDGIKYIFDYATSVNKPCVINLSLGCATGPHDGTSTFDKLADSMQGEGRIIVGAAGNEGDVHAHISKTFTSELNDSLSSFMKHFIQQQGTVDIWGEEGMKYTVQLYVYNWSKKKVIKYFDIIDASLETGNERTYSFTNHYTEGFEGQVSVASEISPLNGKPRFYISSKFDRVMGGNYIGFTIRPLTQGTVHAWADSNAGVTLTNLNLGGYTEGDGNNSTSEIGGTGKRVVTVGAYVTRNSYADIKGKPYNTGTTIGNIASFSSLGPTPDGRIKPEVTAPGSMIFSSVSSYFSPFHSDVIISEKSWNDKEYYYGAKEGTSMASPCVAGIIATWLQANNELTPEDIKSILKKTSIQDSFTGQLPEGGNGTWGYGKINAWEGIKESLRMNPNGIISETVKPILLIPNGSNGFNLLFAHSSNYTNLAVFDVNGRKVYTQQMVDTHSGDEVPVSINGITPGIYMVKVTSGQTSFVSKIILN